MTVLLSLLGAAALLSAGMSCYWAWRAGRAEKSAENSEKMFDAENEADLARDRLRRDPDFAGRLRRRFTR